MWWVWIQKHACSKSSKSHGKQTQSSPRGKRRWEERRKEKGKTGEQETEEQGRGERGMEGREERTNPWACSPVFRLYRKSHPTAPSIWENFFRNLAEKHTSSPPQGQCPLKQCDFLWKKCGKNFFRRSESKTGKCGKISRKGGSEVLNTCICFLFGEIAKTGVVEVGFPYPHFTLSQNGNILVNTKNF